jgi:hypothetical protein
VLGTPGDIISECPGDFVGIRTRFVLRQQKPQDAPGSADATFTTNACDEPEGDRAMPQKSDI